MVVKYTMPCFESHRHGLSESPDGYIVQASDYDSLLAEYNKLKEEVLLLKKQLEESCKNSSKSAPPKKKKAGPKYGIKTPIDDDEEWVFVKDLTTDEIVSFDSKEEAETTGPVYGIYRVEKL